MIRSTLIFAAIAMVPLVAGADPETAFLIFVGSMTCNGIWLFLRVWLFGGDDTSGNSGALGAPECEDPIAVTQEVSDSLFSLDHAPLITASESDTGSAAESGGEALAAFL